MNDGSMIFVIIAFWLRDSRVVATMNASIWDAGDAQRRGVSEKPHPGGRLADEALKGQARCRTDRSLPRFSWVIQICHNGLPRR